MRDPAAAAQPRGQRLGRVAGDGATHRRLRVRRSARVAPEHALAHRAARVVDGHGARPLAGDADGHHAGGVHGRQPPAYGLADNLPPELGVLGARAAVADEGRHRRVLPPQHLAVHGDEADLGAAGAEVDAEDEVTVGHAHGRTLGEKGSLLVARDARSGRTAGQEIGGPHRGIPCEIGVLGRISVGVATGWVVSGWVVWRGRPSHPSVVVTSSARTGAFQVVRQKGCPTGSA